MILDASLVAGMLLMGLAFDTGGPMGLAAQQDPAPGALHDRPEITRDHDGTITQALWIWVENINTGKVVTCPHD